MVRSFRFTATLTAMQLATSLVRVVLALGEAAQTATRQLDAESKKKGKVRGRHCKLNTRGIGNLAACTGLESSCNELCGLDTGVCVFCKACTVLRQALHDQRHKMTIMMMLDHTSSADKQGPGHVAGKQGALRGAAEHNQPQPEPGEQPEGDHSDAVPGPK